MTKNQLLFNLEPKSYPYLEENRESTKFIKWGCLKVVIVSDGKGSIPIKWRQKDLPAGDYYLKVYGGGTDYTLDVELIENYPNQ